MREIKEDKDDGGRVILVGNRDTLPASIHCDDAGPPRFQIAHDDIALDDARALIAAWDRAQGALPELPQGYVVEADYEDWLAWSPRDLLLADTSDKADAIAACWAHYAATLDPKWAQLLRNAGLPV